MSKDSYTPQPKREKNGGSPTVKEKFSLQKTNLEEMGELDKDEGTINKAKLSHLKSLIDDLNRMLKIEKDEEVGEPKIEEGVKKRKRENYSGWDAEQFEEFINKLEKYKEGLESKAGRS